MNVELSISICFRHRTQLKRLLTFEVNRDDILSGKKCIWGLLYLSIV